MAYNAQTAFGTQQDFGTDVSASPDLDPSFSLMTGNRVLEEIVIRRLTTETGTVVDDPDFGTDIRAYLNSGDPSFSGAPTQGLLYQMKADIERELVKDQRIAVATATCTYNAVPNGLAPANSVSILIVITAGLNPFTLNVVATALSISLLKTG